MFDSTACRRGRDFALLLVSAITVVAALTGCAPEPGSDKASGPTSGSDSSRSSATEGALDRPAVKPDADALTGRNGKLGADPGGASWPELNSATELPKAHTIPPGFPVESLVLPDGASIDDAGQRSSSEWFVVLRAPDLASAGTLWSEIIEASGLVLESEVPTTGNGISAELGGDTVAVQALTIPQDDGSVLLSYDVTVLG